MIIAMKPRMNEWVTARVAEVHQLANPSIPPASNKIDAASPNRGAVRKKLSGVGKEGVRESWSLLIRW